MRFRMFGGLFSLLIGFALPALSQFDAAKFTNDLNSRFGPPLTRRVFQVKPDVEMVVDYAANGNVCRIELPPFAREGNSNMKSAQAMDAFVAELVPMEVRGGYVNALYEQMSRAGRRVTNYENVSIAELLDDNRRTGVAISFVKEVCARPSAR